MKLTDDGMRQCDNHECALPATHTLVWDDHKFFCLPHALQALQIAGVMGFPTPEHTLRNMTIEEMMPESEGE